jgi:hypothetical protein
MLQNLIDFFKNNAAYTFSTILFANKNILKFLQMLLLYTLTKFVKLSLIAANLNYLIMQTLIIIFTLSEESSKDCI